jgi:hypothetical protein
MQLQLPFASKELANGKKLFRKKHGYTFTLNASGETTYEITVPYAACKVMDIDMLWFPEGVTCDFKILDTEDGDYSGVPNYMFNQYGFDVAIGKDHFSDSSPYDADLYGGMRIVMVFNNISETSKTVGVNIPFHEVV